MSEETKKSQIVKPSKDIPDTSGDEGVSEENTSGQETVD